MTEKVEQYLRDIALPRVIRCIDISILRDFDKSKD